VNKLFLIATVLAALGWAVWAVAQDVIPSETIARDAAEEAVPDDEGPAAESLPMRPRKLEPFQLPAQERARIALLTIFGLVWFFWLGAAMGSYLNVVVYRMPLGLQSVAPDSRCPKCSTRIRWFDNIPVYSWLALRGRCRACREPISPRYLLVEVFVGTLFVDLLCLEVLSGGATLPIRPQRYYTSMPMIEHFLEWDLVSIYLFHAALLWFLAGAIIFRIDKHMVPIRFINWGVAIGILLPTFWPGLRPDALTAGPNSQWSALWTGIFGMVLALFLLTFVVRSAINCASRKLVGFTMLGLVADAMPPLMIAGAFLGGRALTSIVCWSMLVLIIARLISLIFARKVSWSITVVILIAAILHLAFWNTMTGCPWWPGPETSFGKMAAMVLILATGCSILGRLLPPASDWETSGTPESPADETTITIDVVSREPLHQNPKG
jgi:prepilin signal peptidase PulO-like enzyme (type II secretory pathway)